MVNSVARCLEILEILSKNDSCGITELSEIMRLDKSSVHRIVTTMKKKGFVDQIDERKQYVLSLKVLELGNRLLNKMELAVKAKPYLQKLNELSGETSHLAVLMKSRVIYIDRIASNNIVAVNTSIGGNELIYCSATGKAILAFLPDKLLYKTLRSIEEEGFKIFTKRTISSIAELEKELAKVRERNYAFDNEERHVGVRCVAAPIRNHRNEVIASMGISGPTSRVNSKNIKPMAEIVIKLAHEASVAMGSMAVAE